MAVAVVVVLDWTGEGGFAGRVTVRSALEEPDERDELDAEREPRDPGPVGRLSLASTAHSLARNVSSFGVLARGTRSEPRTEARDTEREALSTRTEGRWLRVSSLGVLACTAEKDGRCVIVFSLEDPELLRFVNAGRAGSSQTGRLVVRLKVRGGSCSVRASRALEARDNGRGGNIGDASSRIEVRERGRSGTYNELRDMGRLDSSSPVRMDARDDGRSPLRPLSNVAVRTVTSRDTGVGVGG